MAKNINNNSIEKQFESIIISFHYKLVKEFQKEALRFGLTPSQLEVLRYVGEEGDPTMRQIAEHLNIKPPSVTTMIEDLCKRKLLKKIEDRRDKRITRIIFFPKIKRSSFFREKRLQIFKRMFASLSNEDKKKLIIIITNLINE